MRARRPGRWLVALVLLACGGAVTWRSVRDRADIAPSVPREPERVADAPPAELRGAAAVEARAAAAVEVEYEPPRDGARERVAGVPADHDVLLVDDPALRARLSELRVAELGFGGAMPDDVLRERATRVRRLPRTALVEVEGGFAFERAVAPGVAHAYQLVPFGLSIVASAPSDAPLVLRVPPLVEAWVDVVDARGNTVRLDGVTAQQVVWADGAPPDTTPIAAWPPAAPIDVEVPLRVRVMPGALLRVSGAHDLDDREATFDCAASLYHRWVLEGRRWLAIELAAGVAPSLVAWERVLVERETGALETPFGFTMSSLSMPGGAPPPEPRDAAGRWMIAPDSVLIPDVGVAALVLPRTDEGEPLRVAVAPGAERVVVRR